MYELRLCVTKECNFKCTYCRPGGEGIYNDNDIMTVSEIEKCISFLVKEGFDSVRITGGEPFLRKDLIDIINTISNIKGINNVSMVTNGSILNKEIIKKLKNSNISSITVSLDTMDPIVFNNIVKVDCFDKIIQNIIFLREADINTRINMVVTKENIDMLPELMIFCSIYGVDIKLLDLNNNGLDNWEENYVDFDSIITNLRKKCVYEKIESVRGNVGTPMHIFNYGNYNVIIKDSKKGTCYIEDCKECEYYPCQTGVSSPIITHDGQIKFCNLGDVCDFNVLKLAKYEEQFNKFSRKYNGLFFLNKWDNKKREKSIC